MSDLLRELEEKRNQLNKLAEEHRRERDRLNAETKKAAQERDILNAKVRELVKQASEHRERRDALNKQVQEAKVLREELNRRYNEDSEALNRIKRDRLPDDGPPLSKLKRELQKLEFKQMTQVLTPEKERELVEILRDLQAKIREREKVLEANEDIRVAMEALSALKEKAEEQHRKVSKLADEAQAGHDAMVRCYEEADKLRLEADAAQERCIAAKIKADEEHQKHIELIRKVHDFDKIIAGLRSKQRRSSRSEAESSAKKQAEDVYERFKAGEKLSTEDLLLLQKCGYL